MSKGTQTGFNQPKIGKITHSTLKISFCITIIVRFEKTTQVIKILAIVTYGI